MLDMGFYDDIMQIVKQLPAKRQNMLFSATMPNEIQHMARAILHDPAEVKLIEEIPADYLKGVEFHYVNNISEVWKIALLDEKVADAQDITPILQSEK